MNCGAVLIILQIKSDFARISRQMLLVSSLCALLLCGCRRRKTEEQYSSLSSLKSQPEIRVLLLNDISEFAFSCDANINIKAVDTQVPPISIRTDEMDMTVKLIGVKAVISNERDSFAMSRRCCLPES